MFRELKPKQTDIQFSVHEMKFLIRMWSDSPKRHRRLGLLSIFRAIRPIFEELRENSARVWHWDGHRYAFLDLLRRRTSFYQVPELKSDDQKLGYRIRLVRLDFGLSQREFAKRVGISTTYVSEIERGRHVPKRATIERIRAALAAEARQQSLSKSKSNIAPYEEKGGEKGGKKQRGERSDFDRRSKFAPSLEFAPGLPFPLVTDLELDLDGDEPAKLIAKRH
jgi:transcriptional regulator with XRE-family HTH domain